MEKNENRGTNRFGRRFDEEFKRDAVKTLKSGEQSAQQLSQELGVLAWSLKRWSKEFSLNGQMGEGVTSSEPASELESFTRQRDILSLVLSKVESPIR